MERYKKLRDVLKQIQMEENNEVKIGNKDFLVYIRSVELLMRKQQMKIITLKARGKNIVKCVDVAEAAKNKFLNDINVTVGDIKTYTDKYEFEGRERFVSCIDIELVVK